MNNNLTKKQSEELRNLSNILRKVRSEEFSKSETLKRLNGVAYQLLDIRDKVHISGMGVDSEK